MVSGAWATDALMPSAMGSLRLSLAGIGFAVRVVGDHAREHVTARFGAFISDGDTPEDVTVTVTVDPPWRPAVTPVAVFPAADGRVLDDGRVSFVRLFDELTYEPTARIATGRTTGTSRDLAAIEDPTPIDTPLRLLLSYELPRRRGLLVHACGFADPRGAVVFMAPSGGGKTTTARKLPHATVLSDDQVALRWTPEGWCAWSLPFVGEYARATRPQKARLRAVVLLSQASEVSLARVSAQTALPKVLSGTVYFVRGDPGSAALLDHAIDLVASVPVYSLGITRDAPVGPVLDEILR